MPARCVISTESRCLFWDLGEWMDGHGRHVSFDGCFKHTLFARPGQHLDAPHVNKQLWIPDADIRAVENTPAFFKPTMVDDTCAHEFRGDNKDRPVIEYRNVSQMGKTATDELQSDTMLLLTDVK